MSYGEVVSLRNGLRGLAVAEWYRLASHPEDTATGPWLGSEAVAAKVVMRNDDGTQTYDVYNEAGAVIRRETGNTFQGYVSSANPFVGPAAVSRQQYRFLGFSLPVWGWGVVGLGVLGVGFIGYRFLKR